jgi:hypothetical protein
MTKIIYPSGCAEDLDKDYFATRPACPLHDMPPEDEPEE